MSLNPELSNLGILLGCVLAVLHVAKMVLGRKLSSTNGNVCRFEPHLALDFILVNIGEVVFGKLKRDSQQDVEAVKDLGVECLRAFRSEVADCW